MKDRLEKIIKDYLVKEFGNENALPKPVLNGIVDAIDERIYEIHRFVQEEYDMEDIEEMATANEVELTEEEKGWVLHRYQNIDDGDRLDTLSYIINSLEEERKEKK